MKELVWCAINVSEGRNEATLSNLQTICKTHKGIYLQHIDIGKTVNRTVFSIFAEQNNLPAFANVFFKNALANINMENQTGAHPRIGAVDVFPIVPLNNSTYEQCILLSKQIGKQVGTNFKMPVYLYELSQQNSHRKRLEQIRKGNYENFSEKMNLPNWEPDFGATQFNSTTGATVIGARKPLVAINFSIQTDAVLLAKNIAKQIRESSGNANSFKGVKAIGWYIPEYKTAQVSVNITDVEASPLKFIFDKINELAATNQTFIHKTELIGLIPKSVLLQHFSSISDAITYFRLNNELNPNIQHRIIELNSVSL